MCVNIRCLFENETLVIELLFDDVWSLTSHNVAKEIFESSIAFFILAILRCCKRWPTFQPASLRTTRGLRWWYGRQELYLWNRSWGARRESYNSRHVL